MCGNCSFEQNEDEKILANNKIFKILKNQKLST